MVGEILITVNNGVSLYKKHLVRWGVFLLISLLNFDNILHTSKIWKLKVGVFQCLLWQRI